MDFPSRTKVSGQVWKRAIREYKAQIAHLQKFAHRQIFIPNGAPQALCKISLGITLEGRNFVLAGAGYSIKS
jgi:hypothetical protein